MAFQRIDAQSKNAITSALNLFELPTTNVAASRSSFREYLTLNPINSGNLHFSVESGSSFVDLSKCYLLTEMHIEKQSESGVWGALTAADKVAPIQAVGATFMRNMIIKLNGIVVYNANSLQAYRAYLDMLMSYGTDAHNTHLKNCGWVFEENPNSSTDGGVIERANAFAQSKKNQFVSRIHADLFLQERFLINQMLLEIEISQPSTHNFTIFKQTEGTFRLILDSCKLFVKTVDIVDSLALSIAQLHMTHSVKYPIRKVSMTSHHISEHLMNYTQTFNTDQIPRRLVIALVDNAAFNGTADTSPFHFTHANIRTMSLLVNGMHYPITPYDLDFNNKLYARVYHDMQENLGFAFTNSGNILKPGMLNTGFCIFVFNLTNSLENEFGFELVKPGSWTVNIAFDSQVPAGGLSVIYYAERDSIIMVDHNRTVTTDMTA